MIRNGTVQETVDLHVRLSADILRGAFSSFTGSSLGNSWTSNASTGAVASAESATRLLHLNHEQHIVESLKLFQ